MPTEKLTKHILVPLDELEAAEVALKDALALARSVGADITLLEVVQPLGDVLKTKHRDVCIDLEWPGRVRKAVSYLLSVTERPVWKDVSVREAVEFGEIAETITSFARFHSIDFIVWPPIPLGKAAARSSLELDSRLHPQTLAANVPAGARRGVFEHNRIHNEKTEPWFLEDSMEELRTQITGG